MILGGHETSEILRFSGNNTLHGIMIGSYNLKDNYVTRSLNCLESVCKLIQLIQYRLHLRNSTIDILL